MTSAPFAVKGGTPTPPAPVAGICPSRFDPARDCTTFREFTRVCLAGESGERCRGIQFLRFWTPAIAVAAVLFGLVGVGAFIAGVTGIGRRQPQPAQAPPPTQKNSDVVATD